MFEGSGGPGSGDPRFGDPRSESGAGESEADQTRSGQALPGEPGGGEAGYGQAGYGQAGYGQARRGQARYGEPWGGEARYDEPWGGEARYGEPWGGEPGEATDPAGSGPAGGRGSGRPESRGPDRTRPGGPGAGAPGAPGGAAGPGRPGMARGRSMESLTGRLLVATPSLRDPNFERTVVLLVAHEEGGALGVVLNRATEVSVSEVLGPWGALAEEPAVVFEGGPVQPEAAICLARARPGIEQLAGFNRVAGAVGTVDLSADPDTLRESVLGVRVFAGYAGWSPGQLESEIEGGSWFVFDALPGDAFAGRPDDLWPMVLRRQGGLLAAVAHYPTDPALN